MKTVRFTQVVARCGKPEPHTLWVEPEDDRELQAALRTQRVMTVHQQTAGKGTDHGEVGLTGDRRGNLLIFPKSLEPFAGRRVVGVKYELLDRPPPEKKIREEKPEAPPARAPVKSAGRSKAKPSARAKSEPEPEPQSEPEPEPEAPPRAALRIFRAEEEPPKAAKAKGRSQKSPRSKVSPSKPPDAETLLAAIRRALKQLQAGKAVAAYETLQKAGGE